MTDTERLQEIRARADEVQRHPSRSEGTAIVTGEKELMSHEERLKALIESSAIASQQGLHEVAAVLLFRAAFEARARYDASTAKSEEAQ